VENEILRPAVSDVANSATQRSLRTAGVILAGSTFVALSSHVALPLWFTPVPLTLQPFAVLLLGLLLGPEMVAATLSFYLLEGAAGLPVFAPGLGFGVGLAHLLGPTGGYLMSYPAAGALISLLRRELKRGIWGSVISASAGNGVILICGMAWFAVWTHGSFRSAFTMAVLPFLPGDALKVIAAAALAKGLDRIRQQR
jgi:biotin transport system substrate-specific component